MKKLIITIALIASSTSAFAAVTLTDNVELSQNIDESGNVISTSVLVFPDGSTQSTAALYFVCPAGQTCVTGTPGPIGPQGPAGLQGPQGFPGVAGADGLPGADGPQGATGPQGPAGLQGPQGIQGEVGLTASAPIPVIDASTIADGSPYVSSSNSGPFQFWTFHNMRGTVGPQGIQGLQGDTGPAGPPGSSVSGAPSLFTTRRMNVADFVPTWLKTGSTWSTYIVPFTVDFVKTSPSSKLRFSWTDNVGIYGPSWCSVGLFVDTDLTPVCAGSWSGVSASSTFAQQQISCLVDTVADGSHTLEVKHRSQYCVYGNYAFDAVGYNRVITVEEVF